jgi:hypothetical protein
MLMIIRQGDPHKLLCSWMENGVPREILSTEEQKWWPASKTIVTDGNQFPCK